MTREEIVKAFDRRHTFYTQLDAAGLAAGHAENCVHESPLGGHVVGRQAMQGFYQGLFNSFPDFSFERSQLLVDGSQVVEIGVVSGTNLGGFMGLPPTGRHFSFAFVFASTLKNGLIAKSRTIYDFTGWMVQTGVLKAKPH